MNHDASHAVPLATSRDAAPRGAARRPIKLGYIQACSGAIFALFLFLHLMTAASGLFGPERYDTTLSLLRHIYRPHIAVELFVVGASATVHIACAILQMLRRRKVVAIQGPLWMRAHRLAGYFLLLVILGHVAATRIAPMLATGSTSTGKADFAFLAFAVLAAPGIFWPYYLLLAVAGATHLGLGLHIASRVLRRPSSPRAQGDAASEPPQLSRAAGDRTGTSSSGPSSARVVTIIAFTAIVAGGVFSILLHAGDAKRDRFPEYKALLDKLLP